MEIPVAVICNGPTLLFSVYTPELMTIAIGLTADAILLAV